MGKILDALRGKSPSDSGKRNDAETATDALPEERTSAADGAVSLLRTIGTIGLYVAVLLIPVVVIAALYFIGNTLYTSIVHLGTQTLVVNPNLARFTAFSMLTTLALLVVAGVALSRIGKRRTLLISGLFALMWLAITVVLALVDTWLTAAQIEPDPTLLRIGVFVYSALPALPAIPIVALAYSAAHERDGQYETIAAAAGAMGFSLLKAFGAVAMFSIEAFFGISIGVNPVAAIFAALLNATAFIMALGNIQQSVHENDHGGVRMWGAVSVFYAFVIFAIAAEAIITFSGGRDGNLKAMNPPVILEWFAQWAFVSSIGLSAMLIAVSFWRKAHKQLAPATPANASKVTITRPSVAHRAGMIAARPSLLADEFRRGRDAARGTAAPQLPAGLALDSTTASPAPAENTADGWRVEELTRYPGGRRWSRTENGADLDVVAIPGRLPNWTMSGVSGWPLIEREADSVEAAKSAAIAAAREHKAEPVKGRDYDTTGEVVLKPEDDAALREAFWRQMRNQQGGASGGDGAKK